MLESCISFFWECILVKLGSYIIFAMLLVITCKRPHSKIPHRFPTVLKCLSACQLRKTMKNEIFGNFLQTWSPKCAWLFQVIWYFDTKSFLKHYLEHCWNKKIPQDSIPCTLGQKKRIVLKFTKFSLLPMDFEQFYEFPNTTYPFGFFATCFKLLR